MNTVNGILRTLIASALGYFVAKGLLTQDQVEQIITLVLSLGGIVGVAVWSYVSNSLDSLLKQVADSDEVVKVEVEEPALANAIPSEKVVPVDPARNL